MSRWWILVAILGRVVTAQSLPLGQIIDDVQGKGDASQHYSLYLPSHFTPPDCLIQSKVALISAVKPSSVVAWA